MACPECENLSREYLIFRKAVARFAVALDQLEQERQRIHDENRPDGAHDYMQFEPILLADVGKVLGVEAERFAATG